MTRKQEAFCLAYAQSGNATRAALEAGYSERTARWMGSENLAKPDIQNRLREIAEETKEESEKERKAKILNAGEMQEILSKIIMQELTEQTVVIEGQGNGFSEARFVDKKPSFKDIVSAIDKLARMQGAYNDKVSIDGVVPVVLCDDIGGKDES